MTQSEELRVRLNAETARIEWQALEPHFARGAVVRVAPELDLVGVAAAFAEDNRERVAEWMTAGQVGVATDTDAAGWSPATMEFWAVVVAPWVLVQEVRELPAN